MFGKYFLSEMRKPDISQRMVSDMEPVLFEPSDLTTKNKEVFYTVYRNLGVIPEIARYDITVIPPRKIGSEFAKTFGHYHRKPYPEIYEVLEGRAYFLLQRYENDPGEIKEVYIVEAEAGQKAVMPPSFGHLTINVGEGELALANWIGPGEYDYETIKKYHGGCYYVLSRENKIEFKKNPNYKSAPEIKKLKLKNIPELGIKNDKNYPIWNLKNNPGRLDWLTHPEKYQEVLTIKNLYREI